MIYLEIFYEFFMTGLFAIGGGLATLPFLRAMSETHPEWFTIDMLGNMVAVSNAAPGPIGINLSAYVGYTVAGIPGGIIATIGLVLPSIIVIMIVVSVLDRFKNSQVVGAVFLGLRPAVTVMIALADYELVKLSILHLDAISTGNIALIIDIAGLIFAAAMFIFIRKIRIPIVGYIIIGAVFGIISAA